MKKARELTKEEVRNNFIKHLREIAVYWEKVEGRTCLEKIEGAIFSTLVTLDGESADLPAFIVAPFPNSSDKEYQKKKGQNWYPENDPVKCDIAGSLHDLFYNL